MINVISWLMYYTCYIRYQICTLYAKMIRLCPDTIQFSMMDKQLNAIKTYCTECVLRGLLDCLLGLCDIAMIPYVHSLLITY